MRNTGPSPFPIVQRSDPARDQLPLIVSLHGSQKTAAHLFLDSLRQRIPIIECFGGFAALVRTLDHVDFEPEAILIELEGKPDHIFQELGALADHVPEGTPVFGFGALNDVEFYRSLLAIGLQDYFLLPFDEAKLNALLKASDLQGQDKSGTVIGFIGLAGGVGTTVVASNFANFLRLQTQQDIPVLTFRPSAYAQDPVLLSPDHDQTESAPSIKWVSGDTVVIETERQISSHIILDIGTCLDRYDILSSCDHFVLVGEPDFKSLAQAPHLNTYLATHYPFVPRHFVLNKIGNDERIEFSSDDFSKTTDIRPLMLYRYSPSEVTSSLSGSYPILPAQLLKDRNAFALLARDCQIPIATPTQRNSAHTWLTSFWHDLSTRWS